MVKGVDFCPIMTHTTFVDTDSMKRYPLGIDNPIKVKAVMGSHKWALYWKDDMTKIATFPNEFVAMQARRSIIESL